MGGFPGVPACISDYGVAHIQDEASYAKSIVAEVGGQVRKFVRQNSTLQQTVEFKVQHGNIILASETTIGILSELQGVLSNEFFSCKTTNGFNSRWSRGSMSVIITKDFDGVTVEMRRQRQQQEHQKHQQQQQHKKKKKSRMPWSSSHS